MSFKYEDLNEKLFDKVVTFSYSIGSGLGDPGEIIMLTNDGKEYVIGQEEFEGDWICPENTFYFMAEAFDTENDSKWIRISSEYASERIYCRKEIQNGIDSIIEDFRKKNELDNELFNWENLIWQILGMDSSKIEHIIYDKTKEICELEKEYRKQSEEHFARVLLKPDAFEWRKLYFNNAIPKENNVENLLLGCYLLLFKKVDAYRIDGSMMTIAFQREQSEEGKHTIDAKVETYNLFYSKFEDVRGPLEMPVCQDGSPMKELENSVKGHLSCYSVNKREQFIRSYNSLEGAKKGAMYWLEILGGIDSENVIPYGTIRSDAEELHKREVREAELYMMFITRYADVIEVIKRYDYPGNAADEVAEVLGIARNEVGFIYDMFDPVLFSASRLQTIERMVGEEL